MAPSRNLDFHGHLTYWKLFGQGILSVSKLLITNGSEIKKLRNPQAEEKRYVRPEQRYELPKFEVGMRYCTSSEKYLRPTRLCNSHAPEVVALANELGAYQKSDQEFAEAAFSFAKDKMTLEIKPICSVEENLRNGTGTCFELITVFIALCRAAGIKARYKIFATHMVDAWRDATINKDPILEKWYDSLGYFLLEGEGEAFIDGEWRVAHVGPTAERQAASGIPITELGEDAIGVWFHAKPGSIMLLESIPAGLAWGSKVLHKISPASMERINVSVVEDNIKGKHVIEQAGGVAAYNTQARETLSSTG